VHPLRAPVDEDERSADVGIDVDANHFPVGVAKSHLPAFIGSSQASKTLSGEAM